MIKNIIQNDFKPPRLKDQAIDTLAVMEEYKIEDIPIVDDNNKLLGIITESSIINMNNLQESLYFIKNQLKPVSIVSDMHIFQGIKLFHKYKSSIIPVTNKNDIYMGYIRPLDVISQMCLGLKNDNKNSILIISTNHKDYTLHEISRLVEENSGKISFLWSEEIDDKIKLHLMINCMNSQMIIQALERYDYAVSVIDYDNKPGYLDDRFETFVKYLNT